MNNQLTLLLIITGVFFSYGQDRIHKTGVLLNFEQPINGAHILNLSSLEGTSSKSDGSFTIRVKINDTLLISHLKYHSKKIIYSKKHQNDSPWVIYLDEMTNMLDTVLIKNHDLSGMLALDSKKMGRVKNIDSIAQAFRDLAYQPSNKDFGRDLEKPPLNSVDPTGGPSVGGAFGVGFRFKDLELRRELKVKKDFPTKLISDLSLSYFTNTLHIPEEKVYNFITYCQFKNIRNLYSKNQLLKVIEILEQESIEYLKIKD